MVYTTFWQRVGALVLDAVVFLPIIFFIEWLGMVFFQFYGLSTLIGLLLGPVYYIYLVKHYGATPGKLMMHMRVLHMADGTAVGYRSATLRYVAYMFFFIPSSIAAVVANAKLVSSGIQSESFMQHSQQLNAFMPTWYIWSIVLAWVWMLAEIIVILSNNKRRAIHDFVAGTVVIRVPKQPAK